MKSTIVYFKIILITFFLAFYSTLLALQNIKTIDKVLQKELNIQEKILEQILNHHDRESYITQHDVKGHYVDDYGILFLIPRLKFAIDYMKNIHFYPVYTPATTPRYRWSEEEGTIVKIESRVSKEDSIKAKKHVDQVIGKLHAMLFEFFADYFSTFKSLKSDQNVCVYFRLNIHHKMPVKLDNIYIDSVIPIALKAEVSMEDLRRYRRGKISEQELDKRIAFDIFYSESDSYNYRILSEVLETELQNIESDEIKKINVTTTYMYLDNYGLLFFLDAQRDFLIHTGDTWPSLLDTYEKATATAREKIYSQKREKSRRDEEHEQFIHELRSSIIKIIGQYGHTLDDIKDGEWIAIIVNFGATFPSRLDTKFTIRLAKKDIIAYNQEKLSLERLIDKAEIVQSEK